MGNPVPSQIRSVDPYSSYNSDVVNKLTRIISDGNNILLTPSPIDVSQFNQTNITALEGKAIMQDVLIEIQDINIDLTDSDFYVDDSGGVWNEIGYYYVVLAYQYQKTSPPPEASIMIILPSQRGTLFDPNKHLFLKCLEVSNPGSYQIDSLLDYDPDNLSVNRDDLLGGTGSGKFVFTDKHTPDVGNSLYNVGTGVADRFNEFWIKTLHVETISYTSNGIYGTTLYGSGTYGDLAERYSSDPSIELEPGTVVELSDGDFNVESCNVELSPCVAGVVSTDPAYILNSQLKDGALVGLVGRIPTKIIGPINKKDIIVSDGNGCARAASGPEEYMFKIGVALETDMTSEVKLIECLIK